MVRQAHHEREEWGVSGGQQSTVIPAPEQESIPAAGEAPPHPPLGTRLRGHDVVRPARPRIKYGASSERVEGREREGP